MKLSMIIKNDHPLKYSVKMLKSGKSLQSIRCKTNLFMNSFFPQPLNILIPVRVNF